MPFKLPSGQANWVLAVGTGLVLLGLLLAYNYQLGQAKTDGALTAQTQCVADTNAASLKAAKDALARTQQQLTDANAAVQALADKQQELAARNKALQGEIDHVTNTWLPPGKTTAEPQPACMFTRGFVRVYNQSIATGATTVPAAARAGNADAKATTSAAVARAEANQTTADADLQPSRIGRSDILQHIGQYGQRCQQIEAQLTALQDYLQKQGIH